MIIDSPVLTSLPVGVDRIIPEPGDAQVMIPSIITPIISPVGPLTRFRAPNLIGNMTESVQVNLNITRNNAAAIATLLVLLAKGFWEISAQIAVRFDYTGTGSVADTALSLNNETNTVEQFMWGTYASVRADTYSYRQRFLFADVARLELRNAATALAETSNTDITIVCNRIL